MSDHATFAEATVATRLNSIICDALGVDPEVLTPDCRISHLVADQLEIYDIVLRAEEAFEIYLDDDDIESARTVGDLVDLVEQRRRA